VFAFVGYLAGFFSWAYDISPYGIVRKDLLHELQAKIDELQGKLAATHQPSDITRKYETAYSELEGRYHQLEQQYQQAIKSRNLPISTPTPGEVACSDANCAKIDGRAVGLWSIQWLAKDDQDSNALGLAHGEMFRLINGDIRNSGIFYGPSGGKHYYVVAVYGYQTQKQAEGGLSYVIPTAITVQRTNDTCWIRVVNLHSICPRNEFRSNNDGVYVCHE
jgi:hypothetical protein